MKIDIQTFRGTLPKITSRRLPPGIAAEATNAEFETATLAPINMPSEVFTFGADVLTIYRFNGDWLGWDAIVDVARAPVAPDRLYYTGDGVPKVLDGGTTYNLALPAPVSAPNTANIGVTDPDFEETILFVYTWVTSLGEESAPSPASAPLQWSPGLVTTINSFAATPAGRAITHRRIYRSITSASGVTSLLFAVEIPIATTSVNFDISATPLQEPLETQDYGTPPANLKGLVSMPNGMMAAFDGRDLYFCEPYKPHAWPVKYVLTMDWTIVGLSVFGSTVAVLTAGSPYLAQGITPDSMALEKMETGVACVSRRGIVDLGYSALYPSPEGLALISPTETRLVTLGIYSLDQWQNLTPESIVAQRYKGRYLFCYTRNEDSDIYGGTPEGWDTPPAVEDLFGGAPDGWSGGDVTDLFGGDPGSAFGERRFASLDMSVPVPDVIDIEFALPLSMWRDETGHETYYLDADKRTVYLWADPLEPPSTAQWRSGILSSVTPVSFGVAHVRTQRKLLPEDTFEMRLYVDGTEFALVTKANSIERLPAIQGEEYEVEITTTVPVVRAQIAGTPDEVARE